MLIGILYLRYCWLLKITVSRFLRHASPWNLSFLRKALRLMQQRIIQAGVHSLKVEFWPMVRRVFVIQAPR